MLTETQSKLQRVQKEHAKHRLNIKCQASNISKSENKIMNLQSPNPPLKFSDTLSNNRGYTYNIFTWEKSCHYHSKIVKCKRNKIANLLQPQKKKQDDFWWVKSQNLITLSLLPFFLTLTSTECVCGSFSLFVKTVNTTT